MTKVSIVAVNLHVTAFASERLWASCLRRRLIRTSVIGSRLTPIYVASTSEYAGSFCDVRRLMLVHFHHATAFHFHSGHRPICLAFPLAFWTVLRIFPLGNACPAGATDDDVCSNA